MDDNMKTRLRLDLEIEKARATLADLLTCKALLDRLDGATVTQDSLDGATVTQDSLTARVRQAFLANPNVSIREAVRLTGGAITSVGPMLSRLRKQLR
jgi:hypothetical protein